MRRRATCVTLALVAAFAVSGCGNDNSSNNGNDNTPGATPTRTATPAATQTPGPVATTTQTSGGAVTATPTTGGPQPSATQTPGSASTCEGAALTATITTSLGALLDTGWTGISHGSVAPEFNQTSIDLNCDLTTNLCQLDGTKLVGQAFGAPLPLSSGGVPVCVLNVFREATTGTYNCTDGSSTSSTKITSSVFLVQDIAKPCPNCVGDATPNDGVKGGTCEGSTTTPGAPCDVGGISPDFGPTSNDCLPTGTSVGDLAVDLDPLTTGTIDVPASVDCASPFFPKGSCYCPNQVQPNACTDGVCPPDHLCTSPINGLCSTQRFRSCRPGTGTADCEAVFPGAGTCVDSPQPCFGLDISRTGTPGTQQGVLVSVFCIPATKAPAINTTAGLAGPGALSLPGTVVRVPR